jgi:hypothetical protein
MCVSGDDFDNVKGSGTRRMLRPEHVVSVFGFHSGILVPTWTRESSPLWVTSAVAASANASEHEYDLYEDLCI